MGGLCVTAANYARDNLWYARTGMYHACIMVGHAYARLALLRQPCVADGFRAFSPEHAISRKAVRRFSVSGRRPLTAR